MIRKNKKKNYLLTFIMFISIITISIPSNLVFALDLSTVDATPSLSIMNAVAATTTGAAITYATTTGAAIVDTTAPVMLLVGDTTENVVNGDAYTDKGVTITDNKDTGLIATVSYTRNDISVTSVNTTQAAIYLVHYNVSDAAGNKATEVVRTVVVSNPIDIPISEFYSVEGYDTDLKFALMANVNDLLGEGYKDTTGPAITLVGDETIKVAYGANYLDPGVTITDDKDTGLVATVTYTKNETSVFSINTSDAGTYIVHYNVSDAVGNAAIEVTRKVIVEEAIRYSNGGGSTATTTPTTVSNTDVTTVVDYIKKTSSESITTVDVTTNKQVAKDIFDAIKGTDKTVIFTQDGIQWTFKGSDITGDTKAIDMTVKVATLEDSISTNKVEIGDKVKGTNVMLVSFANNGQLPGKARIKLKLDATWLSDKDKDNMNVYYFNEVTNKLENVASKLQVDADGYMEFVITHNSDYIITDKKISVEPTTVRLGGTDRYDTSVKISQNQWTTSEFAVLATGEDFPDALSAAPFAKQLNAPILLTPGKDLYASVSTELTRLQVKKVYIIGGKGAISEEIESAIKNMNVSVERISGEDRYDTSLAIAEKIENRSQVFLSTGFDFPDALSISSYAAANGDPILLVGKDSIKPSVLKFINDKKSKVYVIGGTGVIQDSVMDNILGAERISGRDRYETNLAVLDKFNTGFDFSKVYFATGENFPDALSGSALAGVNKAPIILINNNISDATKVYIKSKLEEVNNVNILGGEGVISTDTLTKILN